MVRIADTLTSISTLYIPASQCIHQATHSCLALKFYKTKNSKRERIMLCVSWYSWWIFFWWYWGLNCVPHACWAGALPFEPFFPFTYFSDRVLSFCQGLASDHGSSTYASQVAGITTIHHYNQLVGWDGVFLNFCLGWLQTYHVADIIGTRQHTWPYIKTKFLFSSENYPVESHFHRLGCTFSSYLINWAFDSTSWK
jgi:hypothetical protein